MYYTKYITNAIYLQGFCLEPERSFEMEEIFQAQENRKPAYFIFRASITKNGVKYYAKDYGKKAFCIPIYN